VTIHAVECVPRTHVIPRERCPDDANVRSPLHHAEVDGNVGHGSKHIPERIGIVGSMAIDPKEDADLVQIDTSHLFPTHTTWIGFRRGGLLRKYQFEFMQLLAPHLTKRVIDRAAGAATQADVDELVKGIELPVK
jgi:hypothetical protein